MCDENTAKLSEEIRGYDPNDLINEARFAYWAVIDLFGHVTLAGYMEWINDIDLWRVDVPMTSKTAGFTKFIGKGAIYGITPVHEEVARLAAENIHYRPVDYWVVATSPMSPAYTTQHYEYDHPGEDDDEADSNRYYDPDEVAPST
jgi:hypothetical protein